MGEARRGLEQLQREAAAHRARRREAGRHLRWPEGFRRRAVTLLDQGLSVFEVSQALVINRRLISGWRRRYGSKGEEASGFTELSIAPAADRSLFSPAPLSPESGIVLTGSGGASVAGLGFHQIAYLLQAGLL